MAQAEIRFITKTAAIAWMTAPSAGRRDRSHQGVRGSHHGEHRAGEQAQDEHAEDEPVEAETILKRDGTVDALACNARARFLMIVGIA